MTNLIVISVMLGIFIAMVVVNYHQTKRLEKLSEENQERTGRISALMDVTQAKVSACVDRFDERLKDFTKTFSNLKDLSDEGMKRLEDFIELCDDDYKKQIKTAVFEKEVAVMKYTNLLTAIKSLENKDRTKIQYRLDRITGLKNGEERKEPITKEK